ncbi:hypothetical protein JCM15457_1867 [Liquorilactobacillus sucicola DSM 21376 = JCM 15457]|uniref:Integral membrane protein n=1 Tax=Liquorilactobacillus sucicola DSM 21376 = JCM 15457 TaxID=1423806 RepID=A0A023CZH3_9LACO|nr:DUF1634 domain-containing protein [Liquorilactobacillus sucicola]KRN07461.1 hypothetical protein FD15_GL000740 [Liquorilactobacillus sucicola DSM 21376 = JCM 15457]GAJ26915.1 hypothetical protein JCM15457_1867 [Liquorilactobacillus sucicola DSM 21376 = JCM 15457]
MNSKNKNTAAEMEEIEIIIGKIMRVGVLLATLFMLAGLLLLLITSNSGYPGKSFPTTIAAILSGLTEFKAFAFMMTGIFLLILTPFLRVVISVYAFYKEKDTLYVYITLTVLFILIISFLIGHH